MNNDSPQSAPTPPPEPSPTRPKNWPLWLGLGVFGGAAIALLIALISLLGDPDPAPVVDNANPPAAAAPDGLQAQQQVRAVINDLDRAVLVGDSPTMGNPDAAVVLLEFSDFECPYCARSKAEVATFMAAHEADVLLVFKHLPLTNIHAEALPAALAAWAAGQQDQFWPYHDALFAQQADLGEALYVQTAEALGLDLAQFNRDRASEAAKAAIARDLALAAELQLNSTPTFILDTLLIPGAVPAAFFSEALERIQAAE